MLFVRNNRLHLAWGVIEEYSQEDNPQSFPKVTDDYDDLKNDKGLKVQLALSEYSKGKWLQKKISKEALYADPGKLTVEELQERKALTRFYILDKEPVDPFGPSANLPEAGFFVLCYGYQGGGAIDSLTLVGAFNLSGCKSFPEVAGDKSRDAILSERDDSQGTALIPEVKDARMETQRWIESDEDFREDLNMRGIRGYQSRYEPDFGKHARKIQGYLPSAGQHGR